MCAGGAGTWIFCLKLKFVAMGRPDRAVVPSWQMPQSYLGISKPLFSSKFAPFLGNFNAPLNTLPVSVKASYPVLGALIALFGKRFTGDVRHHNGRG
jgi:hypothetical protein